MSRPAIPKGIKRSVRQRCGFGCVVCGVPLYDYDHMPGYANVKRHLPREITLLCPTHHAQKTRGLLSDEQVVDADANPFNLRNGKTSPLALQFAGDAPEIQIAKQRFSCEDKRRPTLMIPVMVDGKAPMSFTIDTLGLMLNLYAADSTNRPILIIRDSELVLSTSVLDIQFTGQHLTIVESSGLIALSMFFSPPNKIEIDRYRMGFNGALVEVRNDEIVLTQPDHIELAVAGDGQIIANIGVLRGVAPRGLSFAINIG